MYTVKKAKYYPNSLNIDEWIPEAEFETEKEAVDYAKNKVNGGGFVDTEPNGEIAAGFIGECNADRWSYMIEKV